MDLTILWLIVVLCLLQLAAYSNGTSGSLNFSTNLTPLVTVTVLSDCLQSTTARSVTPTIPTFTTTFTPTHTPSTTSGQPPGSGIENIELIAGAAGAALGLTILVILLIMIASICVVKKKRNRSFKQPRKSTEIVSHSTINHATDQMNYIEPENVYDTLKPSSVALTSRHATSQPTLVASTSSYETFKSTNEILHSTVEEPQTLTQNVAYGDIHTSTSISNEQDYYVNEGLNNPEIYGMYGHVNVQSTSSLVAGPTEHTNTENEMYYANMPISHERVDTEDTYHYVR